MAYSGIIQGIMETLHVIKEAIAYAFLLPFRLLVALPSWVKISILVVLFLLALLLGFAIYRKYREIFKVYH